jgi:hypothetical protein
MITIDLELKTENARAVGAHARRLLLRKNGDWIPASKEVRSREIDARLINPLTFRQFIWTVCVTGDAQANDDNRQMVKYLCDASISRGWREPESFKELKTCLTDAPVVGGYTELSREETRFLHVLWDEYESVLIVDTSM